MNVFDDIFFEYGNLLKVESLTLIGRYNDALKKITGKKTALTSFHIDCSGFSPEVAKELGDDDYLNTHGVNKKFILISMNQIEKDIAHNHFSSTLYIIREFYQDNFRSLAALTTNDAVYGELDNKQFKVNTVDELLNSNTVHVSCNTGREMLTKAKECMKLTESVKVDQNWNNDELLNRIIELSRVCGNTLKNDTIPDEFIYQRSSYYTKLLGGMYIFPLNKNDCTLIVEDPLFSAEVTAYKIVNIISIDDKNKVFKFLSKRGWLEGIEFDELKSRSKEFELKQLHSALNKYITKSGVKKFSYMDENALKRFIYDNYDSLPSDFYQLERFTNALLNNNKDDVLHKSNSLYNTRVSKELDVDIYSLLSHLVSHYTPYSYLRQYTYNRDLFNTRYEKWTPIKQDYIKTYLYDHAQILHNLKSK